MKNLFLPLLLLPLLTIAQGESAFLLGKWTNEEKSVVIEFYPRDKYWHGRVVWLKDSLDAVGEPRRDVYNSNPKMRSRKIVGIDVLSNLQFKKETKWSGGDIYHFETGSEYNAIVYKENDDLLRVKGYWWFFRILGRTKYWSRLKQDTLGQ